MVRTRFSVLRREFTPRVILLHRMEVQWVVFRLDARLPFAILAGLLGSSVIARYSPCDRGSEREHRVPVEVGPATNSSAPETILLAHVDPTKSMLTYVHGRGRAYGVLMMMFYFTVVVFAHNGVLAA